MTDNIEKKEVFTCEVCSRRVCQHGNQKPVWSEGTGEWASHWTCPREFCPYDPEAT